MYCMCEHIYADWKGADLHGIGKREIILVYIVSSSELQQ